MHFNQATDYAFRIMLHLAQLPPGSVVNARTLATDETVSPRFLLKIMRCLCQAGLVYSRQGTNGGYELAKPAAEVSLLDVVEALEGPPIIQACLANREACSKHCSAECPVHATLGGLQRDFVVGLARANFAALAAQLGNRKEVLGRTV